MLDWVKEELVSGNTGYSSLTSEQQSYIWYIYTMLKTEGVFDTSNVDNMSYIFDDCSGLKSINLNSNDSVSLFLLGNSLFTT